MGRRSEGVPDRRLVAVPQRQPDALTSTAYATDFNEIKSLGGNGTTTSTMRTADQTRTALFWTGAGGPFWSVAARDLIEARGIDLADSARLLAMMNLAAADASINCWNDKYRFDFGDLDRDRPGPGGQQPGDGIPRRAGRLRKPVSRSPVGSHVSRRRAHRRDTGSSSAPTRSPSACRASSTRDHPEPLHPALPARWTTSRTPASGPAPLPERRRAGEGGAGLNVAHYMGDHCLPARRPTLNCVGPLRRPRITSSVRLVDAAQPRQVGA